MVIDIGVVRKHIKPKADSTLYNMRKVDLIEYIRTLEHNYNVAVSFNENQAKYIESLGFAGGIVQQWIPIEDEQKPKDRREYFIAYVFGDSDIHFFGAAKYHAYEGNGVVDRPHFSNEGVNEMRVTHWMEIPKLPQPPKGE
jgi:hypothetical protein